MHKILIVNPPVSVQSPKTAIMPLPCLILGRILRNLKAEGVPIDFELLDLDLILKQGGLEDNTNFYERAAALILEKNPDTCLFSTHGLNTTITIQLCQKIKMKRPSILTVLGGVAATLQARDIVEHFDAVDMIVKGEAEPALPTLIRQAVGDKSFQTVPSAVLIKDGDLIDNPRQFMRPEEELPRPDYSLIDMEVYRKHNEAHPYIVPGFALVESGRGCQFNCTFCAPAKMWERRVRKNSLDQIIEEMTFLKKNGFDFTFFTQDNLDVPFLRELSTELIQRQVNIPWGGYARINQIDDETLELLLRSGCKLLFVGLESPNERSQKYIRKVLKRSDMLAQIKKFKIKGIRLIGSFIAGFDGETTEELTQTLEFALECSAAEDLDTLKTNLRGRILEDVPAMGVNFCTVHPLAVMPGTDFAKDIAGRLRTNPYTYHHDAYGSPLMGFDDFTKKNWRYVFNTYVTHLSDSQVAFYYPVLRLFNMLNARPYHLAWFLAKTKRPLLTLLVGLVNKIGKENILRLNMQELEKSLSEVLSQMMGGKINIQSERVASARSNTTKKIQCLK